MDYICDLSAHERDEVEAETAGSKTLLYLVGHYEAAASIPIGATLPYLEREHELLPPIFQIRGICYNDTQHGHIRPSRLV